MIKFIKALQDSSIDELNATSNYGLNNTLFLKNEIRDYNQNYNSRILIKFDLNEILDLISNGIFSNPTYYLNLYAVDYYNVDFINNLEIYPISGSWMNGNGVNIENYYLQPNEGVSWKFRENMNEIAWDISNFNPNVTCSYQTNEGGGNWYENYKITQSLGYNKNKYNFDIRVDISEIVNQCLSGSIENNGIIIKRTDQEESDTKTYKEISYFSKDSTTIYYPKIEIIEDDSIFNTGSLSQVDLINNNYRIYSAKLKNKINQKETHLIQVNCNELYPKLTYQNELTSSYKNKSLTSQSYYEVICVETGDIAINQSDGTKISVNDDKNYFKFDFSNLNRHYNYKFRYIVNQGDIKKYYDDNKIFTIE
jgi:hypothetical protein